MSLRPSLRSIAMLALGLSLASPALARPPGPPPGPPPPPDVLLAEHADELGLDAATLAEARRITEAAKPELERLHEQARTSHEALHDKQKELMDEVMDLLTEEQRTQLEALMPPPPPRRGPPPPRR